MGKQKIENNFNLKEKLLIRIFLALFIISIFAWIIPSTIGFITFAFSNTSRRYAGVNCM